MRVLTRKLVALLTIATLLASVLAISASPAFGARPVSNPAGDIDQCANGGVGKPPIVCTGSAWQNGNLNGNQAHYSEGESVPYRLRMTGLVSGSTNNTVTIEWDTTQSGKHALDYLTSFNRTETTANACSGVTPCSGAGNAYAIPVDPNVTGGGVTPVAGQFRMWGGTITGASAYTLSGTYAGSSSTRITLTFTASQANPVLAWGGHIATRIDWGANASAVSISGSPFHMRFLDLNGSGGNQDRSLSNDAVIFPATINIVKDTSPNDATLFTFTPGAGLLAGSPAVQATAFQLEDDGVGTGNTKALSTATFGSGLSVVESDPAPAYLVSGSCAENMTQDSSFSGRTATIVAQEGETITCTFVNTRQNGTIVLNKVVQSNHGGNAGVNDFGLSIGGQSVQSGGSISATPGTAYAINEAGLAGYEFVSITGAGCPAALGGTVTVAAGATVTCTITNRDLAPTLALVKVVDNDAGGNNPKADWTLTATPAAGSGATTITGAADVTATAAKANVAYTLTESSVLGYTNGTTWTCSGAGVHQNGNTVTLDEGAAGSCSITNADDAPSLALTKTVSNTSGGNDPKSSWTLSATPADTNVAAVISGAADVNATTARSNMTYTLSESAIDGYSNGTTWTCTDAATPDRFSQTSNTVTLFEGAAVSCNVTNTDQAPTLKLDKTVASVHGGNNPQSDWTLTATPETNSVGAVAISGAADVGPAAAKSNVVYTLSESSVDGYTNGTTWTCTDEATPNRFSQTDTAVTLFEGAEVTCSITNTDIAPTLALDKVVDNQHGGNNPQSDWTLTATPAAGSGATTISGSADVSAQAAKSNVVYTLTESSVLGYTNGTTWTCTGTGVHQTGNTVWLDEGGAGSCSITNTDQAPTLALTKVVNNAHGGNDVKGSWTLTATPAAGSGASPITGTADVSATAGKSNVVYTLSESSVDGYTNGTTWTCTDAASPDRFSQTDDTVTLAEGAAVSCSITNQDQAPTLALTKTVSNSHGGNNPKGDWTLTATPATNTVGAVVISGGADVSATTAKSNVVYALSESSVPGYTNGTVWTCTDAASPDRFSQTDDTVTLFEGAAVSCNVTNTDEAPTLALDKTVADQFGGGASEDDFVLKADPTSGPDITDAGGDVEATAAQSNMGYTLSETTIPGYTGGEWSCSDAASPDRFTLEGNVVTLEEGAVVTCSITNHDSKAEPSGTTVQRWVLHDSMTISGIRAGGDPNGLATVTFRLYSDEACSTLVDEETVGIDAGVASTADGIAVTETGFYYWRAEYSGDAYNLDFTTDCGDEITQIQAKDAKGGGRNDLILPD